MNANEDYNVSKAESIFNRPTYKSFTLMRQCLLFLTIILVASNASAQTFEEALAAAYRHDPKLQAEQAKLRATDEQVSQALSGWRPSIDANAEAGKNKLNTNQNPFLPKNATLNPRDASVSITQPVFRGFRTQGAVSSAEATVKAGRASLQNAEQQLLLDASKAYLDVWQAQQVVDINREIEKDLKRQHAITTDRLKIGDLKKTDVDQANSRLQVATVTRIQAEGDLLNKRTTYTRLIGEAPGTLMPPKIIADIPKTEEDLVAAAQTNNPNVQAANYNQQAAHFDVTTARGNLLPEVNVVGAASTGEDQNVTIPERQDSFSLMAKVTVPLYRSGADYSKTRAAKQTFRQRDLELADAKLKAQEEASTAWQSWITARDVIEGNKAALDATDKALYGVKIELKGGTRTTLDLLNAEQELLNAKVNMVKADHDEKLAVLQIKASIGTLTADAMHLPVDLYDPKVHYNKVRDTWFGTDE